MTWALVAQLGNACSRGSGLLDVGFRVMGFMAYALQSLRKKARVLGHCFWIFGSGWNQLKSVRHSTKNSSSIKILGLQAQVRLAA